MTASDFESVAEILANVTPNILENMEYNKDNFFNISL
jgi:hypothetical protein